MNNILKIKVSLVIPVMIGVWLLSLLYSSGIGQQYDVYGKVKIIVICLFIFNILVTKKFNKISKKMLFFFIYLIVNCTFTKLLYGSDILDYVWLYLLILLIGTLDIQESHVRAVSCIYGFLGLIVLFIYNYGSAFSGWNTNSIAIIGFFSFAVMTVSFNRNNSKWIICVLVIYFCVYCKWSSVLNSRGGILFAFIVLLGALKIIPFQKLLKTPDKILFVLLIPFMIALVISLIRNTSFAYSLDVWSQQTFNKPIFNGRDDLFYNGFLQWLKHPVLGNGNLSSANWHNSAVTMLVGCGFVGFLIWIFGTRDILKKAIPYFDDNIVYGLIVGFVVIWLQQSVELGLVAAQANAIPYAMLGLLIGRINTLKKQTNRLNSSDVCKFDKR